MNSYNCVKSILMISVGNLGSPGVIKHKTSTPKCWYKPVHRFAQMDL